MAAEPVTTGTMSTADLTASRQAAQRAVDDLRDALRARGVVLPSLDVDLHTFSGSSVRPLVELGRCTPEVAGALAALVRKGGR
ncbi:hypothetical protein H7827_11205 [Streptomyces sp. JH002]|uniref:hypothetical protein n=1 Tax=Streptomyces sp. JH002 TaxID=2763259 RepID=UPI003D80883B